MDAVFSFDGVVLGDSAVSVILQLNVGDWLQSHRPNLTDGVVDGVVLDHRPPMVGLKSRENRLRKQQGGPQVLPSPVTKHFVCARLGPRPNFAAQGGCARVAKRHPSLPSGLG